MKSCIDFPDAPACCPSCHEDMATGYDEDMWYERDGDDLHVCCTVIRWIDGDD